MNIGVSGIIINERNKIFGTPKWKVCMGPHMSKCTKLGMAWNGVSFEMGENKSLQSLP
jgi:hypothetical protein